MPKRFAIIIESGNIDGQNKLPGAEKDVKNWKAFLRSNAGGSWNANEICVLHKPKVVDVSTLKVFHEDEYIFLVFSGHGEEVFDRLTGQYSTQICLNEKEQSVDVRTLAPSRFGTAIFDCCRGVENAVGNTILMNESSRGARGTVAFMMLSAKEAFDHIATSSETRYRTTEEGCRKAFLTDLATKTNDPTVCMYSCGRNEGAGEDPEAGGYYTTLLLKGANDWFEAQKIDPYYRVYTTKQAHDFAVNAMRVRNPQQHPEYTPSDQNYPFAVG